MRSTLQTAALAVLALALTGCQGILRVQPVSQVRIIDASPDSPAIDIQQGSAPGLYNVGFGTVSSYIPVAAGAYTQTAYAAGTGQRLAAVKTSLLDGGQYTVLTGNSADALQMTVLRDRSTPAPAGQVALRVLNQTTRAGAFDLYLLPADAPPTALVPLASNATFGADSGYINAPSGTYSIIAFPAGIAPSAATPAFTGAHVSYPSGAVRTLILIDQAQRAPRPGKRFAPPALQILTANDFDPPAAS